MDTYDTWTYTYTYIHICIDVYIGNICVYTYTHYIFMGVLVQKKKIKYKSLKKSQALPTCFFLFVI
jgi:hypothetical protein